MSQAGLAILASAVVGATAAAAPAKGETVMVCNIKIAPVHVYTDPIPFDPSAPDIHSRIQKIWDSVALKEYGKGPDDMKNFDDMICWPTDNYNAYVRNVFTSQRYINWKRVPFPVKRIHDGSEISESAPQSSSKVNSKPRADIIIEDSKPTMRSPAEMQKIVLQEQRDDAARRAKTMAAAVKDNAKAKDMLAKLLEKERKRGRSQ